MVRDKGRLVKALAPSEARPVPLPPSQLGPQVGRRRGPQPFALRPEQKVKPLVLLLQLPTAASAEDVQTELLAMPAVREVEVLFLRRTFGYSQAFSGLVDDRISGTARLAPPLRGSPSPVGDRARRPRARREPSPS